MVTNAGFAAGFLDFVLAVLRFFELELEFLAVDFREPEPELDLRAPLEEVDAVDFRVMDDAGSGS